MRILKEKDSREGQPSKFPKDVLQEARTTRNTTRCSDAKKASELTTFSA
jgi:hypothetical protein